MSRPHVGSCRPRSPRVFSSTSWGHWFEPIIATLARLQVGSYELAPTIRSGGRIALARAAQLGAPGRRARAPPPIRRLVDAAGTLSPSPELSTEAPQRSVKDTPIAAAQITCLDTPDGVRVG
jgi:hypothetical protein